MKKAKDFWNKEEDLKVAIQALKTVSFYACINHGDKSADYGKIVDPVLKHIGVPTGEL